MQAALQSQALLCTSESTQQKFTSLNPIIPLLAESQFRWAKGIFYQSFMKTYVFCDNQRTLITYWWTLNGGKQIKGCSG